MGCQQFRKARGITARHAAFGGYAVDPDMAPGGGEASSVAGHVVAVNGHELEIFAASRNQLPISAVRRPGSKISGPMP